MIALDRRLDDLKSFADASASARQTSVRRPRRKLRDVVGGDEHASGASRFWRLHVDFASVEPKERSPELFVETPVRFQLSPATVVEVDPSRTLVLDIETGGFSGTPVFLIGVVALNLRPLAVEQWLARDYPEEEGILRQLAEWSATRTTWVTFNGKSFDAPFVLDRARIHGVRIKPPDIHIDLLHAARRRWSGELPDCRLTTLETHVLGRERVGDTPGCDVPDLFHHFIRTQNAAPLKPVLEHNQLDLITSTELLLRMTHE